jgi:hypothetical protein
MHTFILHTQRNQNGAKISHFDKANILATVQELFYECTFATWRSSQNDYHDTDSQSVVKTS